MDLLQALDLQLCSQDIQQNVSAIGPDEVEVEIQQRDFRRAVLQDPRETEQKVICQFSVPQNQLLNLVRCAQHHHHSTKLCSQPKKKIFGRDVSF